MSNKGHAYKHGKSLLEPGEKRREYITELKRARERKERQRIWESTQKAMAWDDEGQGDLV